MLWLDLEQVFRLGKACMSLTLDNLSVDEVYSITHNINITTPKM